MEKKITVFGVIPEGIQIGLKNAASLLGAIVLYILTIWIPYLNVGTTIAMATIPIELAKGKVISPTFIFDAKYRKSMGEYFLLVGLKSMAIYAAFIFLFVPGIVLSISWSLALYILLDKGALPMEALRRSNKATYGYKWTIFGVGLVLGLACFIVCFLVSRIPYIGFVLVALLALIAFAAALGCNTVIYKKLVLTDDENVQTEVIATEETSEKEEEKQDTEE